MALELEQNLCAHESNPTEDVDFLPTPPLTMIDNCSNMTSHTFVLHAGATSQSDLLYRPSATVDRRMSPRSSSVHHYIPLRDVNLFAPSPDPFHIAICGDPDAWLLVAFNTKIEKLSKTPCCNS